MTPTNKLRFVEREVSVERPDLGESIAETKTGLVLQQWFLVEPDDCLINEGLWRDVPLEVEEK